MISEQNGRHGNSGGGLPLKPYDFYCITLAYIMLSKDPSPQLTIQALAAEVGINRNKLHYGFKYVYGLTIHDFQERQRLQKAVRLLSTTHKPVKTIAALTGYCNSSRLSVLFKKTFGVTPNQFRKQLEAVTGARHPGRNN
jgi:AraC-like DNA-binding protein